MSEYQRYIAVQNWGMLWEIYKHVEDTLYNKYNFDDKDFILRLFKTEEAANEVIKELEKSNEKDNL